MQFTSTQVNLGNLGDSKILLHQLEGTTDFILTIQNNDSIDVEIVEKKDEIYIYGSLNVSEVPEHVIIESISEKQLAELGSFLTERFPK